ncbi:MAG: hypothetical protein NTY07_07555 [Bacteroidia bacterium]|nr:hypothetical protein [Bacteroidia bacterium]
MKNKAIVIPAVLLIVTMGNYFRIVPDGSVRAVDFLNIWAIGALSGVLIVQIVLAIKAKRK